MTRPAVLLAFALAACTRGEDPRALVERYNRVVTEAYRRADPDLVESVAAPEEARRLLALIGVKHDLGVTLDATLLALEVKQSNRQGDDLHVVAHERWRYRDRQIGTGEPVGAESTDEYDLDYHFRRSGESWKVERVQFTQPPQVGQPLHGAMPQRGAADPHPPLPTRPDAQGRDLPPQPGASVPDAASTAPTTGAQGEHP
jgi:hypothetical protein